MSRKISPALKSRFKKHRVKSVDKSVTLEAVYYKYSTRCQGCDVSTVMGLHPQVDHSATMEHKIPLSMGGNHTWDNVTLLCHKCNLDTNTKMMNAPVRKFRFFGYEIAIKKVAA